MRKKQSPDRLILRWYLVGVLFIAIMTVVICGFSVVHKANTASGFAEPETLFEIFKGEDGEVYATVFGEKYRLENRIVLPKPTFHLWFFNLLTDRCTFPRQRHFRFKCEALSGFLRSELLKRGPRRPRPPQRTESLHLSEAQHKYTNQNVMRSMAF